MKELTLEEAALAWAQGKRVEARPVFPGGAPWSQIAPLGTVQNQMWPASIFNDAANSRSFRLTPEPPAKKFKPWKPEEVPVLAIFRRTHMIGWFVLQGAGDGGVWFTTPSFGVEQAAFNELLKHYEHSIDGGKTWLPCGVEVDA